MKIINFGSINIDHVYEVSHFVRAGETLAAAKYNTFAGGKGLNQSVALAKAGTTVLHAGKIGSDGEWLLSELENAGVNISCLTKSNVPTGHGIIQVIPSGENSILLFGGANQAIESSDIDNALVQAYKGDFILLQNEICRIDEIIKKSHAKGLRIAFNPAPFDPSIRKLPLNLVNYMILNEIEGSGLTGETSPPEIIKTLSQEFPNCAIVLTLGAEGVRYRDSESEFIIQAEKVVAIDTTAAGDTFIGYFLSGIINGLDIEASLIRANKASSICVTQKGAAISIPTKEEVERASS